MPAKRPRAERQRLAQPRLRVLAGPNGSGKSTIKTELRPEWLGVFINADEIEKTLEAAAGVLPLRSLGLHGNPSAMKGRIAAHIAQSEFARALGLHALIESLRIDSSLCLTVPGPYNSYLATVIADAVRRELLAQRQTFTFETVMSSRDKVDFMNQARQQGYRVYLYFVATDDPDINIDRVQRRVLQGGHAVPSEKVRERYFRSIGLMAEACGLAHRAYVFDNSGSRHRLLVQITDGTEMEIASARLPAWFVATDLWKSFTA